MKVFAVLLLASLAAGAPVSQKRFYIYDQPSTHSLADHSHVALFADEFERSGAAPLPVTRYSIATRSVYDKPVIVVVPQEGKEELSAILIDGGLSSLKQNPSLHFLHDRLRLGDEQVGVMLGAAKHFPLRQNDMPVSKFYLPENYKLSKAAELQADIGMVPWMLIAKRTDLEGLNFDKLKIISEYNIEDDQVRVVKDYHTELRNAEAGPAFYRLPTSQYAFAAPLAGSLSEGLYQSSSSQAYNPLLKGVMPSVFGVPAYIQKNIYYLQPSSLAGESLDSRILYHAPANAFVRGEYDLMRKYPFKFSTSDENAAVFDEAISSHIPSRRSNLRVEELKQIISGTPLSHHAAEEIMTSHQRASLAGLNSQINEAHVSSLGNAESLKTTKTISSEGRSISGSTEQLTPGNIKTVTTTTITKESIPSGSYVEANNLGSVKTTLLNKDHILSMPVEGQILRGESSIIPSEIMSSSSKSSMTTSSSSNLEASRDVNSFVKSTVHGFESLPSSSSKTIKTTTVVTKEIVPQTQTSTFVEYLPVSRSSMTTSSASIHGQTSMDVDSRSSVVPASGSKTVKTSTFVTKEINPVSSIEGHILASDESLAKKSQLGSSSTKTTVITSSASGHGEAEASKNFDSSLMSSVVPAEGLLSSGSKTVKTSTVVTKQINPVSSIEGHFLASDESLAKKSELGSSSTKTTVISSSASGHEEASKDIDSSLRSSIVSADGLSASGSKTIKTTTVVTKEIIPGATQVGSTILNGDISSLKTGLLGSSGSTKTTVYTSSASDESQVAKDIDSILKSSIIPSENLSSSGSTKTTKTTVVTSSASDDAQVSKDIDSILKGSIIPSESLSSSGSTKTTKTTVVSSSASDEAKLTKDIDSIVKDSIIPL